MRDRKGWKALGYESFVEYGEKELSLGKTRIYQLAESAEISLQLGFSTNVEKTPSEAQLRPLTQVPDDERKAIWDEATRIIHSLSYPQNAAELLTSPVDNLVGAIRSCTPTRSSAN